jgi:hypothetical protein
MKTLLKIFAFFLLFNNSAYSQCVYGSNILHAVKSTDPKYFSLQFSSPDIKYPTLTIKRAYSTTNETYSYSGQVKNFLLPQPGDGYVFYLSAYCNISGRQNVVANYSYGDIVIPPPTNVIATTTCSSVTLTWDAVTTAIAYWNVIDCATNAVVAKVATNSATFNSLNAHTTYNYKVQAVTVTDFSSDPTACVSATTLDAMPSYTINGQVPHADGSPILVSNCVPIIVDASGSTCATDYMISMEESDIWWTRTLANEWHYWFHGTPPNNLDLIALTEQYSQTQYGGTGKFTLKGGLLPNGQERCYRISVTTTNTATKVLYTLIKINTAAQPLFNINGNLPNTDGSPIMVRTYCGATVTLNAAKTTCAKFFYLGVQESDLWWNRTFANEWGQWFDGSPPDNMDLVALTQKYSSTLYNGTGTFNLQGGTLPNGQNRYYRVGIVTQNPDNKSLYALIRVNPTVYGKSEACLTVTPAGTELVPIDMPAPDGFKTKKPIATSRPAAHIYNLENLPNPFSNETSIQFNLISNTAVSLKVYDIQGALVKTLLNDELRDAGAYSITFDGSSLPAGVYYTNLKADGFDTNIKMILIK